MPKLAGGMKVLLAAGSRSKHLSLLPLGEGGAQHRVRVRIRRILVEIARDFTLSPNPSPKGRGEFGSNKINHTEGRGFEKIHALSFY